MEGYTVSEGGILRPMSVEERKFGRDCVLTAPVVITDFLSSISQIISPRRKDEIIGLAKLIANEFEEHVDTRIRSSSELRVHRDTDEFPVRQYHITLELAYAYQLLAMFDHERYPVNYQDESQRLMVELVEKTNQFAMMPTLEFTVALRLATMQYFDSALCNIYSEQGEAPPDKRKETNQYIESGVAKALRCYKQAREIAVRYMNNVNIDTKWKQIMQTKSLEGFMKELENDVNQLTSSNDEIEKAGIREHYEWILQGMYEQQLEDILFGEMRCYALFGDYDKLIETADVLEIIQTKGRYQPSRLIRESATIVRQQAMNNQSEGLTIPFVADSSEEHAEYIRSLVFGREIRQPQYK